MRRSTISMRRITLFGCAVGCDQPGAAASMCCDPVKDKAIFDAVWTRQLHNPKAFWAPYPLTSIAMDDPAFVRPIPRNSWGGASQALTALRAPRWMALLRQAGGDEPHDAAVVRGDHAAYGVSSADGSADGRVYAGRSERLLAGGAGVSGFARRLSKRFGAVRRSRLQCLSSSDTSSCAVCPRRSTRWRSRCVCRASRDVWRRRSTRRTRVGSWG